MDVIYPRRGGIDVHEDSLVACARLGRGGAVERFIETIAITTKSLPALHE
jgi:hypothetical protein